MAAAGGKKGAAAVAGAASSFLRFTIPAGKASPSPPIGPALGQRGLNIMDFCKQRRGEWQRLRIVQFNERTKTMVPETPVPVVVTINPKDRSFTFVTKTPPVSFFLKKAASVSLGSKGGEKVGAVTLAQVYEIAKIKQSDASLSHIPLEKLAKSVVGSARSMGISVLAA